MRFYASKMLDFGLNINPLISFEAFMSDSSSVRSFRSNSDYCKPAGVPLSFMFGLIAAVGLQIS